MTLNSEQQFAVNDTARNIMVEAVPGAGKTRVVVERILRLVRDGIDPRSILLLTFTNAGADEFRVRLGDVKVGFAGTLHAFCLRLVREHHLMLGLPSKIGVLDQDQRDAELDRISKASGLKCKADKLQALVIPAWRLERHLERPGMQTAEMLAVRQYVRLCLAEGLLDFEMVLEAGTKAAELARVAGLWPFEHLFVDEVQDSSSADWRCYTAFGSGGTEFMVGDYYQSIYSFRGAKPGMVKLLDPGVWTRISLEQNYRSGNAICTAANNLLWGARDIVPAADRESSVEVIACKTPADELYAVLREMEHHVNQMYAPAEEFAVLARTNRQARAVAEFLLAQGVPVSRVGLSDDPPDWKRARAIVAALAIPRSDRVVLVAYAMEFGKPKADQVRQDAARCMVSVNAYLQYAYGDGSGYDSDYKAHADRLSSLSEESRSRVMAAMPEDGDWGTTLMAMATEPPAKTPGIHVGTIHSAKGREFDSVVVVGCEDDNLPLGDSDAGEELRLLYVAMTRARTRLAMTWCAGRPQWRGQDRPVGPVESKVRSRFLDKHEKRLAWTGVQAEREGCSIFR